MENVWSLLCSKALVDQRTKMLSLIEALDIVEVEGELPQHNMKEPPTIGPVSINIVSLWYRSNIDAPETSRCRYVLVGPNGGEFEEKEIEVDLQDSTSRHLIVFMPALRYSGLGMYYIRVEKIGKEENTWTAVGKLPLLLRTKTKKG